ncbi:MAG: CDP-glycerol glycerophosphotransferase family protein [Acutalibacteraceae bacterium]|nr:CDP-glycerol glycerophosphotransferase family protein [Acutalibacteraceae bacterium]
MKLTLRILKRIFWIICFFLPVKSNKVVFQSYYGRGYGDNPKYIADALIDGKENLDLVWVVSGKESYVFPKEIRTVTFRSFKYIYEMSTAKVWVDNSRKEYCLKKKNQFYMQTWHGGLGMKKVENMVPDKLSEQYLRMAKKDAAMCDVMISSCDTLTSDYRNYFWYPQGEIIQKGLPRNDRLLSFTDEDVKRIRKALDIEDGVRLMLYAPTFRENHDLTVYDMDYKGCKEALEKRFGGKWKILLRLHPNVFKLSDNIEYDPEVLINASYYPDMQELYMISDMLITDYSSVIFDFLLIEKPSLLYASDVSKYRLERDFYFDFSSLPFTLCETNDQLFEAISSFDENQYKDAITKFKNFHGFCDSNCASKYAAEWILNKIKGA